MPDLVPITSTKVLAIGWDYETQRLVAQFGENTYYEYPGVPAETAARVIFANSKGRAFTQLIERAGFSYNRITREEAER